MRNNGSPQYRIGALERALEIVAAIGDAEEISLGVLAAQLEIPKGSLLRHLRVLEGAGYVTMAAETKLYSLGPALIHLGFVARQRLRIPDLATPAMRWLRDRYDESVHLAILSGPDVVHVAVAPSTQAIKMAVPVGERTYAHVSALGKSLLAWGPPTRLDEIVAERGLPKLTPQTITTADGLQSELAVTRERGWSMDDEESADGLRCVGAPIRSERDEVIAAVSISAPATRLSREKAAAVALVLCKVADHVSGRLGWRGPGGRPPWAAAAPWSSEDSPGADRRISARSQAG
ncbi:MAG TPA: IclR family transcriptional regulator [Solirubrobacteraceae bacterium]|jgi:IclR family acetate operon transcriptional repressor|nr:IclR family transcriptional regulator [Solirubrobacteraceae bacterium]